MALALVAGVVLFLGFAGFDIWPLILVGFVPLFVAVEWKAELSRKRVFWLTLTSGFVGMFGGYYWVAYTLRDFSGFPLPLCLLFASILFAYQGLLFTVYVGLFVRARRMGWPPVLSSVAALAATELLFPLLFPFYFANSFHDVPLLLQVVDLGGPILLSLLVASTNAAIYAVLRAKLLGEKLHRIDTGAAVLFALFVVSYGALRIGEVERRMEAAEDESLDVGIVQANVDVFARRIDLQAGFLRHLEMSDQLEAAHPELDLMVWPESSYLYAIGGDDQNVARTLPGIETPLVFGGLGTRMGERRRKIFNTAFLVDGDGDVLGGYDKVYLLAFGEYLPFGEAFPILYDWSPNSGHFTAGTAPGVLRLPAGDHTVNLGMLICYEDILPRFVRDLMNAEREPQMFVNVTNDAWFGDTHEPWVHLALAKFRAVEHHRYMVRATNTGVSAIIDPLGRIVASTRTFVAEAIVAKVQPLEGRTLYAELGDWPGVVGLLVIAFLCLRKRGATKPSRSELQESRAEDGREGA